MASNRLMPLVTDILNNGLKEPKALYRELLTNVPLPSSWQAMGLYYVDLNLF